MLKKFLVASTLMAATSCASAMTFPYFGAGLGLVVNSSDSGQTDGQAGVFRGVPLNVFAGFASMSEQGMYLAGELTGTLGTGELSNENGLKTTYGYGFSVIPGVLLSENTLAFARLGVARSRFTNVSSMSTGGQFGVGLQTAVTQAMDIRGEYDFTAFRNVGSVGAPRSDAFNVSLVYKFE